MSHIWIPKFKIIEPAPLVRKAKLVGRFKLNAVRPDGKTVRATTGWFDNLILDGGLNRLGTAAVAGACHVGTNNTAPAVGQSALVARVASTGTTTTSSAGTQTATAPYYGYISRTFRFAQGAAAGNIAEVGVSEAVGVTTLLWSRALVVDGGGSPTTITVLSDEFLDVTYECRLMVDTTDVVSTITIAGVVYDTTMRPAEIDDTALWATYILSTATPANGVFGDNVFAYSGTIGAVTAAPAGSSSGVSASAAAYGDGTLQRSATANFGLTQGNFGAGGIKAMLFQATHGAFQVSFDNGGNGIPKDSSKLFSITFTLSWGRYVP